MAVVPQCTHDLRIYERELRETLILNELIVIQQRLDAIQQQTAIPVYQAALLFAIIMLVSVYIFT